LTAPYYQGPGPQQPAGASAIAVTTKFFPLAFILYFFKPKVAINGQELPQQPWGRQVIPVQPGQYRLDVHTPYFLPPKLGPAVADVSVAPGQTLEVEYKAPAFAFINGTLGPPPQKYAGMWIYWVLLGIFALLFICCCGSALLGNNN
jgi:hypothetical protein